MRLKNIKYKGSGPKDQPPLVKIPQIRYNPLLNTDPAVPKELKDNLYIKNNIEKGSFDVYQKTIEPKDEKYEGIEFGGKKIKTKKNRSRRKTVRNRTRSRRKTVRNRTRSRRKG